MKFIAAKIEQLLCCIKSALDRGYPVTAGTTVALARQTTGLASYGATNLLSISVTAVSGVVEFGSVVLDPGVTVEFEAEPGALLPGSMLVECGSSAGVAIVARTLRS